MSRLSASRICSKPYEKLRAKHLACLPGGDATIAQFNLGQGGRNVDLSYLESLSVDAAPALVNGTAKLPAGEAATLRSGPLKNWAQDVDAEWRGINYGRWRYLKFIDDRFES